MKLRIKYQEDYSRGELLLRTIFGYLYIVFPHMFLLLFFGLWGAILQFISFWVILFTGKYPESFFEYQVKLMRWQVRVNARMYNVSDGYPAFGLDGTDEYTDFDVPYPESLSRGLQLVKLLFGWLYVGIPHGFILMFRLIWNMILIFLAFWVVLFTGRFPQSWHEFTVGTLRWSTRVNLYLAYMTDTYPPFTGDELPGEWTDSDEASSEDSDVQENSAAPENSADDSPEEGGEE